MKTNFKFALAVFATLFASTVQADIIGWQYFASGNSTFGVTTDAASGMFAGVLDNQASGSAALIKQANVGVGIVTPGQQITIRFDAKGDGVNGGVHFAEFFSEIDGGGVSSSVILGGGPLFPPPTSGGYQSYSFMTTTGAIVSGGVTLQLVATTGANIGSTSRLQIDNVSILAGGVELAINGGFETIPEPTSAALLALGGVGLLLRRRRKMA